MVEIRWLIRRPEFPHPAMNALDEHGNIRTERVLQYRTSYMKKKWTDWKDVPTVTQP